MASKEMIERAKEAYNAKLWYPLNDRLSAALDAALLSGEDVGGVVGRLRREALNKASLCPEKPLSGQLETDAADNLESQTAQIASLSAKVAEVERERVEWRLRALSLEVRLEGAEARASELQQEVERLRSETTTLRDVVSAYEHSRLSSAALQREGK